MIDAIEEKKAAVEEKEEKRCAGPAAFARKPANSPRAPVNSHEFPANSREFARNPLEFALRWGGGVLQSTRRGWGPDPLGEKAGARGGIRSSLLHAVTGPPRDDFSSPAASTMVPALVVRAPRDNRTTQFSPISGRV